MHMGLYDRKKFGYQESYISSSIIDGSVMFIGSLLSYLEKQMSLNLASFISVQTANKSMETNLYV